MKPNMGNLDRIIRLMAAATIAVLYFTNFISGTVALILLIVAIIFMVTSFISFCPLYYPFGINAQKKTTKD